MSVKQRLTEYIHYKKLNNSEFCRAIGVSSAFISSMRVSIQPDKIESIALKFPDLNTGWLITGEGEMLKEKKTVALDPVPEYRNSKQEEIDRLNRLVQSQQDTISKLTELLYERKGVHMAAEVAGVG